MSNASQVDKPTLEELAMLVNLAGRVRNTALPKSKPLLPLFEAIVNALHAIEDVECPEDQSIRIIALRPHLQTLEGKRSYSAPIDGFIVEDTGVGFNDQNMGSFRTTDSEYKAKRGGKGVGRIVWLKAFRNITVDSTYLNDAGEPTQRSFEFSMSGIHSQAASANAPRRRGTRVTLRGFMEPYVDRAPRSLDVVATRIIEHCLPAFLSPDCPTITVEEDDGANHHSLNLMFEQYLKARAARKTFSVGEHNLEYHGLRLATSSNQEHKLVFLGNGREVRSELLRKHIPTMTGAMEHTGDRFIYLGLVSGKYLDDNTNSERMAFNFELEDQEQQNLLGEPTLEEITREAVTCVRDDLGDLLSDLACNVEKQVVEFVVTEAPEYRFLLTRLSEFVDSIPAGLTTNQLDLRLHEVKNRYTMALKEKAQTLLTATPEVIERESYVSQVGTYMEQVSDLGQSQLAEYIVRRRVILDFLNKALSKDADSGKYPLEEVFHKIIFPMRSTSNEVQLSDQNLWVLDERLNYHSFLSSDKPLNSVPGIDTKSTERGDIVIFNKVMAFREGDSASASVVLVEFKRPMRKQYDDDEDDPIGQIWDLGRDLRGNSFTDPVSGRPLRVAQSIPIYAYLICDVTPRMERLLEKWNLDPMPDAQGYSTYHDRFNILLEVIPYGKLLGDAVKRNSILFDRLGLRPR